MEATLTLAIMGGMISLASTAVGSLLLYSGRLFKEKVQNVSMDFVLGVMLSVTAFSLVGPSLFKDDFKTVFAGLAAGMIFVGFFQKTLNKAKLVSKENSGHLLLAMVLILHNFPEGMGAGAAMVGMKFSDAMTVQFALSVQNVLEGLLLSLALLGLGWRLSYAVIGGIFSGVIEFLGALLSGFILEKSIALLPFLLALSGGAMLMSLLIEMQNGLESRRHIKKDHFALGFLSIPLMSLLVS